MSVISEREYVTRIAALERLNKSLAEQVDRMCPVVDAVLPWKYTLRLTPAADAIEKYEQQMVELAKGNNR